MRPRISIRGCVRRSVGPSVGPWVRDAIGKPSYRDAEGASSCPAGLVLEQVTKCEQNRNARCGVPFISLFRSVRQEQQSLQNDASAQRRTRIQRYLHECIHEIVYKLRMIRVKS